MPASLSAPRRRIILFPLLLGVILLGLASRRYGASLPDWIARNAGDALWTIAVYLCLALAIPRGSPWKIGLAALGISVLVELCQLLHTPWLDGLRATLPGKLLLGAGFLWADLFRYAAAAALAVVADEVWARVYRGSTAPQ